MIGSIANTIASFLLGWITSEWILPIAKTITHAHLAKRAAERAFLKSTPSPYPWFKKFRVGNIEIPVMTIMGSPSHPRSQEEVTIEYSALSERFMPEPLSQSIPFLLRRYHEQYSTGKTATDNNLPRYLGYEQEGEGQNNEPGRITLRLGLTSFFQFLATNRSLDVAALPSLGRNKTLRETYARSEYDLLSSPFANPLSSNMVLISSNLHQVPERQVIIRKRSDKVALYKGFFKYLLLDI